MKKIVFQKSKFGLNQIVILQAIFSTLMLVFATYQLLDWNLFPWLNVVIIFGSSLLCLIFLMIIKIENPKIKMFILTTASAQLLFSTLFLSQPEILRSNWHWLFFPLLLVFCAIFWDVLSRKTKPVLYIGRISCIILIILTFIKFIKFYNFLDTLIICLMLILVGLILISKNKPLGVGS